MYICSLGGPYGLELRILSLGFRPEPGSFSNLLPYPEVPSDAVGLVFGSRAYRA